jgi:hypothetical protein
MQERTDPLSEAALTLATAFLGLALAAFFAAPRAASAPQGGSRPAAVLEW